MRKMNRSALLNRIALETLESRQMLTVSAVIPSVAVFDTNQGGITVQLTPDVTPITVANFLSYVNDPTNNYNGTIIHRTTHITNDPNTNDGIAVDQGGGFKDTSSNGQLQFSHVTTQAPIVNEFSTSHPNVAGTIAMAKTSDPNSATSEWFFNVTDNPGLDDPNNSGGFTTFGNVIRGMAVVQAINALPSIDASQVNGAFTSLPLIDNQSPVDVNTVNSGQMISVTIGAAGGGDKRVVYKEADGTSVNISLTGGSATLDFIGGNLAATSKGGVVTVTGTNLLLSLADCTGTTSTTTLNMAASGGKDHFADVQTITTDGALNALNGPSIRLLSDFSSKGTVNKVTLVAAVGAQFNIGTASTGGSLTLNLRGGVSDTALTTTEAINSIVTPLWNNEEQFTHTIKAPSINHLLVGSDFAPSLTLSGAPKGNTLNTANIGKMTTGAWNITGNVGSVLVRGSIDAAFAGAGITGDVSNFRVATLNSSITANSFKAISADNIKTATISATAAFAAAAQAIGKLNVRGTISQSTIRTKGNIGSVSALNLDSSKIYAGIAQLTDPKILPDTADEYLDPATIGSVTLHLARSAAFNNSVIAASNIGKLNLSRVRLPNNGTTHGIGANKITSIVAKAEDGTNLNFKNLDDPAALAAEIAARGLNLQDFKIALV